MVKDTVFGEEVHAFTANGVDFTIVKLLPEHLAVVGTYQFAYENYCVVPIGDELPLDGMDDIDTEDFIARANRRNDISWLVDLFKERVELLPERYSELD